MSSGHLALPELLIPLLLGWQPRAGGNFWRVALHLQASPGHVFLESNLHVRVSFQGLAHSIILMGRDVI